MEIQDAETTCVLVLIASSWKKSLQVRYLTQKIQDAGIPEMNAPTSSESLKSVLAVYFGKKDNNI